MSKRTGNKVDNAEIKEQVKEQPSHEVVTEFRDINDFNTIHEAGKDVSHFSPERLESLVQLGHVKKND